MSTTATAPSTKVITGVVRLSFLQVWQPAAMTEGQPLKYSASLIISKKDKTTLANIKAATDAAIEQGKAKWGGKVPKNLKLPLRDGDEERDSEAYEGSFFINATSKNRPGVLNENKEEMMDKEELYSGCYAKVSLNFYPFDSNGNKGIACGLNNIMKIKDGERLSGGASASEDFAEIDTDDY